MSKEIDNYERKPILLDNNTVAFIQIFTKYSHIEDIAFGIYDELDVIKRWEEAAKEFIRQLDGRWCDLFIEALIKECKQILKYKQDEYV